MMSCRRAKLDISLWITDDLNGSSVSNLEEHLARCSDCESYRQSLQESLSDLKAGSAFSKIDSHDSIWPGIANELPDDREMQKRERFHGWMLATAFTFACATMVTFSTKQNIFSWPGEGSNDLDGRIFSHTTDRVEGYRRFRKDSDTASQTRIPNDRYLQREKKRGAVSKNKVDADANRDDVLEEIDGRK